MRKKKVKLSPLEQEFSDRVKDAHAKIKEQLDLAGKAFRRAVDISNETGVPFETPITMWATDKYIPESFAETREKFLKKFDPDFVEAENSLEETESYYKLKDILKFSPQVQGYDRVAYKGWESDGWSASSMYC